MGPLKNTLPGERCGANPSPRGIFEWLHIVRLWAAQYPMDAGYIRLSSNQKWCARSSYLYFLVLSMLGFA